ncbi:hypothetical protein DB88DRAFT_492225 [Papiliotrema laurentii]|uniref:DUF6534 domain-containing protein n=1 Tax=Papiliotrema laurentii TaxID=5418 RepID=A0AAD9D0D0_PAPLA|nr:hypothetical protein DB88DRAFT_492225 [Papiliotrema laurentii]
MADGIGWRGLHGQILAADEFSRPSTFSIYGPIVIGTYIGVVGCGMMLTLMYLAYCPHDTRWNKAMCISALGLAQSASDCSRVLKITVKDQSIAYFLDLHARPEEIFSPVLNIVICTVVQIFLVNRCSAVLKASLPLEHKGRGWYRTRVRGLIAVLVLGVAVCFGSGLAAVIALKVGPRLYANRAVDSTGTFPTLVTIWVSSTAATDIAISLIIVFQLLSAKEGSARQSSRVIGAMIRVAFQGGGLVTALQIITLVTYLIGNSSWPDCTTIFMSKVYSLTLLAALALPRYVRNRKNPSGTPHRQPVTDPIVLRRRDGDSVWDAASPGVASPTSVRIR